MRKSVIALLVYFLLSFTAASAANLIPFRAIASPPSTTSVDELSDPTTQQDIASQRSQILRDADDLLSQAQKEYSVGNYSDAEDALILALSTVRSGDTGSFISPIPRNQPGYRGELQFETANSIDGLYARVINALALESDDFVSDLADNLINIFLTGAIGGDFHQQTEAVDSEVQSITARDVHTIELDILRLLQRVLIQDKQPDKVRAALEVSEEARNLESIRSIPAIAYALNNDVIDGRLTDDRIPELIDSDRVAIEDIKHFAEEEKTTFVYYSVVSEVEIIVWVIQPDGTINVEIIDLNPVAQSLESIASDTLRVAASYIIDRGEEEVLLAEALRTNTQNVEPPTVDEAKQTRQLQQLYQLLIAPIEDYLPTDDASRVVFVPQKELLLIPFAALKTPSRDYLIDQFSIRVTPKLQYVLRDRPPLREFPEEEDILIVGNPANPGKRPLQGAEQEARLISILTESSPYTGSQATSDNVIPGIEDAKVIHLATHGILDAIPPSGDTLLLIHNRNGVAPDVREIASTAISSIQGGQISYSLWPDEDGMGRWHVIRTNGSLPGAVILSDRQLPSQELLNLRLDADLVVLSACNTARGFAEENALLGLPMALGLAGVPQVVVSLWDVPDIATQQLMFEFYLAMHKQGLNIDVADALRTAMLKIKSQGKYQDPIYWAGFTVMDVSH
ncbi:MAG: CHAT domain-containing protein [Leptolyngbya sp. SIOISBB]|nr:CHAT domain-containing protein [Leptolyngbya sp. SIOISBB]